MDATDMGFLGKSGGRVSFDHTERLLYSHDIAAMPNLIKPVVDNTIPDAVAQPTNEAELSDIVAWAFGQGIPITPRGRGSSGYAGAIPVKRGLVMDFHHMRDVLEVDERGLTATVQPGITWEQLDKALKPKGLTIRLYPTS